jgi:hypothetical protein
MREPLGATPLSFVVTMTLRLAFSLLPIIAGWVLATYLQLKAIAHLRNPAPSARLAAFLFGPFSVLSGARFNLDGLRFRGLAVAAFVGGGLFTILLLLLLGPTP